MSPHVRLAALYCVLLLGSAVLAKDKPTPTPAPDDQGQAGEPAKPKDGEPAKPKEGAPTSKPAIIVGEDGMIPIQMFMGEDQLKDLPPGLEMPKWDSKNKMYEYLQPTPEQQKLWVQYHKTKAAEALKKVSGMNCVLVETEHYLIYTNWPAGDHKFLRDRLEFLFSSFVNQFAISSADANRLFLGKMPVFCVESKEEFGRLSRRAFDYPAAENTLGYCHSNQWGYVRLVLYRTESYRGKSQLVRWMEVMSHEGTHAFVARYRSNRRIPAWMNEGLAEYFSCLLSKQFSGRVATEQSDKINESIRWVNRVARDEHPLGNSLFNLDQSPSAEMYPAAWSITKMLIKQSPKAYVQMIKDIKDGVVTGSSSSSNSFNLDPAIGEKALQKNFNCDYDKLETTWRKWVTTTAGEAALRN